MSLPLASIFALRYLTEARLHRLTLGGWRTFWHGERLEALKTEREALQRELTELRDQYLAQLQGSAA